MFKHKLRKKWIFVFAIVLAMGFLLPQAFATQDDANPSAQGITFELAAGGSNTDIMPSEIVDGTNRLKGNMRMLGAGNIGVRGVGDPGDPIIISNAAELKEFADNVNNGNSFSGSYVKLAADIDLSDALGTKADGSNAGWTPIGTSAGVTFSGTFDGDGHTISGLDIDSDADNCGLFGYLTGRVMNLSVSGSVKGGSYVGGICGRSYGVIEDCSFSGSVSGTRVVGGVAGLSGPNAQLTRCNSSAQVTGVHIIGGVVGWANNIVIHTDRASSRDGQNGPTGGDGSVSSCVFSGTVTCTTDDRAETSEGENSTILISFVETATGGIVGWSNGYSVTKCVNEGVVTGADLTGGVVGDCTNGGVLEDCSNKGTVSGDGWFIGGVAGEVSEGRISNCSNNSDNKHVSNTGTGSTGGVVGFVDKWSSLSYCSNISGKVTSSGDFTGGVAGGVNCTISTACYNAGTVEGEGECTGGVVAMTNSPIYNCYNTGTVIGAEKTGGVAGRSASRVVSCYNEGTVTGSVERTGGVIGYIYTTSIVSKCYNAVDGKVSGANQVGGVAGETLGSVTVCYNKGTVIGETQVGGVIGGSKSTHTISACSNSGTVTGNTTIGGVVGNCLGFIDECTNEDAVTGTTKTGGIVGEGTVGLTNCSNTGKVTGNTDGESTGGIAGTLRGQLSGCRNEGAVEGYCYVGGIVGDGVICVISDSVNVGAVTGGADFEHIAAIGGIVGQLVGGTVKNCTNDSNGTVTDVRGENNGTGGIAGLVKSMPGDACIVTECVNKAKIKGNKYVGGIAGGSDKNAQSEISNCNNSGAVTGVGGTDDAWVGGIVGGGNISVSGCENTGAVKGVWNGVGGVAGYLDVGGSVTDCTNAASVEGDNKVIGGITGFNYGTVSDCTNKNVPGAKVKGPATVGGITGYNVGTVSDCTNAAPSESGDLNVGLRIGGIAGGTEGSITGCTNAATATVTGNTYIGGIVGEMSNKNKEVIVTGCVNHAAVTASGSYIGGVAGVTSSSTASVTNCVNYGDVTGNLSNNDSRVGGVIGELIGSAANLENHGSVKGYEGVGGIVGAVGRGKTGGSLANSVNHGKVNGTKHVSGVAGYNYRGNVLSCTNKASGTVTGDDVVGGVSGGNDATVSECVNEASVNGKNDTAGCVGNSTGPVSLCRNIGVVRSSKGAAGGVAGVTSGKVTDCVNEGSVFGNENVGGVVAYNEKEVSGCVNKGRVNGAKYVGGVAGSAVTVKLCRNEAAVTGTEYAIGGVVGYIYGNVSNAEISQCYNTGIIECTRTFDGEDPDDAEDPDTETGGIVGSIGGGSDGKMKVDQCFNTGNVTATGKCTGGIVGRSQMFSGRISNCYNTGNIKGYDHTGGIVGHLNLGSPTVEYCYNYSDNSPTSTRSKIAINRTGRLVGRFNDGQDANNKLTLNGNVYTNKSGVAFGNEELNSGDSGSRWVYYKNDTMEQKSNFTKLGWKFADDSDEGCWTMGAIYSEGKWKRAPILQYQYDEEGDINTLTISTKEELKAFRDNVNQGNTYEDWTIVLTADIDLSGEEWTPIGTYWPFKGIFDGGGHTIRGMKISNDSGVNANFYGYGFFGYTESSSPVSKSVVKDLAVFGDVKCQKSKCGGIVGYCKAGTVERCAFFGNVDGKIAGGIVGFFAEDTKKRANGSVKDCHHFGAVSCPESDDYDIFAGGVVGYNESEYFNCIQNCYHFGGSVTGKVAGGILGCLGSKFDVADVSSGMKNCFYEEGTCGQVVGSTKQYYVKPYYDEDGVGKKLSDDAFVQSESFTEWDFDEVWCMGVGAPRLRSLSAPVTISRNDELDGQHADGRSSEETVYISKGGEQLYSTYTPRAGYVFGGWNTASDGSGWGYADYGTIYPDQVNKLYAQWIKGVPYTGKVDPKAVSRGQEGVNDSWKLLLDGKIDTPWHVSKDKLSNVDNWWIEFSTADAIRPAACRIATSTSTSSPRNWKLEGKNGASGEWVVLAETGKRNAALPAAADVSCYYPVANGGDTYYKHFRVTFSGLDRPGSDFQLAEFSLLVKDLNNDISQPTIKFDSNGGNGKMNDIIGQETVTLNEMKFTRENHTFTGWNTEKNGSGMTYAMGSQINVDGVIVLYAQWTKGVAYVKKYVSVDTGTSNLFDNNTQTTWTVTNLAAGESASVEFGTKEYIKPCAYALAGSNVANNRFPKNWTLEAKDDSGEWVTLAQVSNSTALKEAEKKFVYLTTDNTEEYAHFRITFSNPANSEPLSFSLGEFCLLTADSVRQPVISFNPNGGDGKMDNQTAENSSVITLRKNQFTRDGHEFAGWSTKAVDRGAEEYSDGDTYTVTGDVTLYARWSPSRFTIKWLDDNGELLDEQQLLSGTMPVYKGEKPTRDSDVQYNYTFLDWNTRADGSGSAIDLVKGETTYYPQFTGKKQEYKITWKNWDGSELETDEKVPYGETPGYDGKTPEKEADAQYTYTFSGWDPEITDETTVAGNATYTAKFDYTINTYTVTWENYDGTILETDENVPYGEMPSYDGEKPGRRASSQYVYEFKGWEPTVTEVTGDISYTALFDSVHKMYTINVGNTENGTVTASHSSSRSDETITVIATPDNGYDTDTVTVTDKNGNEIPITRNEDGTYSFTMPKSKVTVVATFKECPSVHLTDVNNDDWFHEYVDYVVENGLMLGVADDRFAPEVITSRAMIVTILYRLEGTPALSGEASFEDVEAGSWYADAVAWAQENEIVNGYSPERFGPHDNITREQFAAIMYRYSQFKTYDVSREADLSGFTDADQISDWALAAMKWANAEGLITGRTETTLVPRGEATRAEAAAILMRFIENDK